MRVFVLTRVRPDGELGPDIRSSTIRTGITGRYDIDLEWADPTATVAARAATATGRPSSRHCGNDSD